MERQLADHFEALGPDVRLRRANLTHLVASLSQQEVRDLRDNLLAVDFRTDIIARLPVELQILVSRHIGLVDLCKVVNVSKEWRRIWLQENIVKFLSRKWMPYETDYSVLVERITSEKQDLGSVLYDFAQGERFRWISYLPTFSPKARWGFDLALKYRGYHPPDPEYHPVGPDGQTPLADILEDPEFDPDYNAMPSDQTPSLRYAYGRVAWQPGFFQGSERSLVVVDNLQARLRRVYAVPGIVQSGATVRLAALGNNLVVATSDRTV